ncbi:hypothetical protein [Sinimarinibacterium sp. CAU 1509]|uniref:hypothetical protein n=1 Tax=Sinimarinibacterium sp. CAU 1509 TaxID=2562283 RepID=UPI00146ED2F2|nr:hypothetical protein [Sinimarinibacterium sp. CAU 1509]
MPISQTVPLPRVRCDLGLQLVLNVPEWFADPAFVAWLQGPVTKYTWHTYGPVGEYSDVIVTIDPSLTGEGSNPEMPFHTALMATVRSRVMPNLGAVPILCRLTNLEA